MWSSLLPEIWYVTGLSGKIELVTESGKRYSVKNIRLTLEILKEAVNA